MGRQAAYSNGETALQMLDDNIGPDALYLLNEPEVSLQSGQSLKMCGIYETQRGILEIRH